MVVLLTQPAAKTWRRRRRLDSEAERDRERAGLEATAEGKSLLERGGGAGEKGDRNITCTVFFSTGKEGRRAGSVGRSIGRPSGAFFSPPLSSLSRALLSLAVKKASNRPATSYYYDYDGATLWFGVTSHRNF